MTAPSLTARAASTKLHPMPSPFQPGGNGAPARPSASSHRIVGRHRMLAPQMGALAGLLTLTAAAEPVLHEYVELGPGTQLLQPTLVESNPRGLTKANTSAQLNPDPSLGSEDPKGGRATEAFDDSGGLSPKTLPNFAIDRDTSRPENMDYEDPFTPTIAPFKRSVVFDHVSADGTMKVFDSTLRPVPRVSTANSRDETFHAALMVSLLANQAIALPSVAPGSRWMLAQTRPLTPIELLTDSADNWFVRSQASGEHKLTLQIAANREVLGSEFPDVSFEALAAEQRPVAEPVKAASRSVATTLGLSPEARPRQIVRTLIRHFRGFRPSERMPQGEGLQLFRELALGGRGICRHRAYSFAVMALGLGLPTRYAMNEAHAWVEVFDGTLWHRIDLGGAAGQLHVGGDTNRPQHVPSPDPYTWPPNSHSGADLGRNATDPGLAHEAVAEEALTVTESPTADPLEQANGTQDFGTTENEPQAQLPAEEQLRPRRMVQPAEVEMAIATSRSARGRSLAISGRVFQRQQACPHALVSILLKKKTQRLPSGAASAKDDQTLAAPKALGTLVTEKNGKFGGQLVIPWTAELGDYEVVAELAPGSNPCRPGRSAD